MEPEETPKPAKGQLVIAPGADPREAARALTRLSDDATVRDIMNRLAPEEAARLVTHAPDTDAQTRLIWSLDKQNRAAVVDYMAPVTLAAMIQNRERRNRRLLGDMSVEHYAGILSFCSPKQRYYWISLANSFADVGANLLVLLLPPDQVAEALLTHPEFRRKLYRLHAFLPGGFEEQPPVEDPRLRAVLTRLIQYDADRYTEVVTAAVEMVEGQRAHESLEVLQNEEPVLLPRIPEVPPLEPAPTGVELEGASEEATALPIPAPAPTDALLVSAARMLTPVRRQALEQEMERAFRDEVVAGGGSLAERDLERAAARLQAYVRLGLQGVPEQPERVAEVVEKVPLRALIERGAIAMERLRQIALRLQPFQEVLDARQRDLMQALVRPQPTMDADSGSPALFVAAVDRRRRPEAVPLDRIQEQLAAVSTWVAVARVLGLRSLTGKLAEAPNGSQAVLAALAVSLLTYGRWDPQALESGTLREFRARHFDRQGGRWLPGTEETLRQRVREWVASASLDSSIQPRVMGAVMAAFEELGAFLRERRVVSWERFAPGKRSRRRRASLEAPDEELPLEPEE